MVSSLPAISEIAELIKNSYPMYEVYGLLNRITSYHRIQGGSGLWGSVNVIKEFLEKHGVSTRIYRIDNGESLGLDRAPIGWDPVYAELEIMENGNTIFHLTLDKHPTLLAAHSPGGEGEAEIVYSSLLKNPQEELGGKAVLTSDRAYLAYIYGLKRNVSAILWYSRERYSNAVPYTGLFLAPNEVKSSGSPVFTLPYRIASRIIEKLSIGAKYRVRWKAEVKYHNTGLPILEASIGDGEYSVIAISHICHPMPGAHDNASGSSALAGTAVALSKIFNKLSLENKIYFYWVPEYTGTTALFTRNIIDPERTIAAINYDMVGSLQSITGSTLHLIRSMLYHMGVATPIMSLGLKYFLNMGKSFQGQPSMGFIRYDEIPYGYGSDHDVFLVNNIDAVMVNEWPSKFYHTDLDTPNIIGYKELWIESSALGLSLVLVANPGKYQQILEDYVKNYFGNLITWYGMESRIRGKNPSSIIPYISRSLVKAMKRSFEWIRNKGIVVKEDNKYPRYIGHSTISSRTIAKELGIEIYGVIVKKPIINQFFTVVLPSMYKGELDITEIINRYLAEQITSPHDIDIKYDNVSGYECLRYLSNKIIEWLKSKDLIRY